MKFDDLIDNMAEPEKADDILAGAEVVLTADDLSGDDKAGFATGFLMGLTYAVAMSTENRPREMAQTLLRLLSEWQAHEII